MTTPISASSRAMSNASFISLTVSGRKALRTLGRLMVILAMPSPVRSYLMSSNEWMVVQVSAMVRRLSCAEEAAQDRDEGVGALPRDAVCGALDDLDNRVGRARAGQLGLGDVLRIARAGDPEG